MLLTLMGKPFGDMLFSIRVLEDIDHLFLLLEWSHNLLEMSLLVRKVRTNHVLAGRAYRQTVCRLVVRPEREALPHGGRLRIANPASVVTGVFAVGHLFDPIGETAHKLPVVVRVAGREIEVTVRGDRSDGTGGDTQLALQAGVVVDWLAVFRNLGIDQDGAQQDEVA